MILVVIKVKCKKRRITIKNQHDVQTVQQRGTQHEAVYEQVIITERNVAYGQSFIEDIISDQRDYDYVTPN